MRYTTPPLALLFLASVALASCRHVGKPAPALLEHEHATFPLDGGQVSHVRLDMRAGALNVRGGADGLAHAEFSGARGAPKPIVSYHPLGRERRLEILQKGHWFTGSGDDAWDVALHDRTPLHLSAHLGAGDARLNLGTIALRRVDVEVGAGRVEVDLTGTPRSSYDVRIAGGVGQAIVHLPATAAISARASGAIGSIHVEDLERRDGRWINPGVVAPAVAVTLDVHGAVGDIRIDARSPGPVTAAARRGDR